MGLDMGFLTCFNRIMITLLLAQLGLGQNRRKTDKVVRKTPLQVEQESLERQAKTQFLKLKEKGLSIPVFTL
ncbi:hypothetical protein ACFL1P_01615 [Patescibacteria group bacterium]